jgi:hypothetical protein
MNDAAVQSLAEVEANRRKISKIEILDKDGIKGVFAKEDIPVDSVIKLEGVVSGYPTKYSIQLDQDKHLNLPTDKNIIDDPDFFWTYLNHSCQPNGYIDTVELTFRPLRKISKGEECTFNYLTTEYEMAVPFACHCGAVKCFGFIQGYKHLSVEQKEELSALAVVHPPS